MSLNLGLLVVSVSLDLFLDLLLLVRHLSAPLRRVSCDLFNKTL
jgi:hypothetical protein